MPVSRALPGDDQDRIADWMRGEFPGMFYILAKALPGHDKREGIYRGWYRDLPAAEEFDPRQVISRFRPDFQRDFAKRIAWSVKRRTSPANDK